MYVPPFALELRNGKPAATLLGTSNPGPHIANTALAAGVRTHVAVTWDGATLRIYLDGVEAYSAPISGPITAPGSAFVLGRDGSSTPLNAALNEVRLWQIARTPTELQSHVHRGLAGSEAGLVAYFRMDDESLSTVSDNSSHGYDGRVTGSVGRESADVGFTTNEDTPYSSTLFAYDTNDDALTFTLATPPHQRHFDHYQRGDGNVHVYAFSECERAGLFRLPGE